MNAGTGDVERSIANDTGERVVKAGCGTLRLIMSRQIIAENQHSRCRAVRIRFEAPLR